MLFVTSDVVPSLVLLEFVALSEIFRLRIDSFRESFVEVYFANGRIIPEEKLRFKNIGFFLPGCLHTKLLFLRLDSGHGAHE